MDSAIEIERMEGEWGDEVNRRRTRELRGQEGNRKSIKGRQNGTAGGDNRRRQWGRRGNLQIHKSPNSCTAAQLRHEAVAFVKKYLCFNSKLGQEVLIHWMAWIAAQEQDWSFIEYSSYELHLFTFKRATETFKVFLWIWLKRQMPTANK